MDELQNVCRNYDFRFSENTTYRLGGLAKVAYFPETENEAIAVFDCLNKSGEKYVILGNGSNVLASDKFFDGVVLSTARLKGITVKNNRLTISCGTTVPELMSYCIKNGVGGLEYLAGIPASLGGLVSMNGGVPSRHIGDDVVSVKIFDGIIRELSNANCNFTNKHSIMRDINCIVLSVTVKVCSLTKREIVKNLRSFVKKRGIQPKFGNCGCVFKNPEGLSAGKLIDQAGLKGFSLGGAKVSEKHANFIINDGATADEVFSLIAKVKSRVYDFSGVKLEEEVVYIGEFNDSYS